MKQAQACGRSGHGPWGHGTWGRSRGKIANPLHWRYNNNMNVRDLITVDPDILGGTPVFKGTRVPIKTLFEYLEDNYSLEEFLECFPSVSRTMACRVLERSESALLEPVAA